MAESDQGGASLAAEASGNGGASASGNQDQAKSQGSDLVLKLGDFKEEERGKLGRFKTGNDLAKSYLALETKLGATVTVPGKDATDEEKGAFYKRLGRPESKDGYALDTLFLSDGVTKDAETENKIREMAFDLGLNPENAKRLHKTFIDLANRGAAMVGEAKEKARDALRKEWGGDYDKNIAGVGTVIRKFGDTQIVQYMNAGPGNEPVMLRFLAKIAKSMSPDTLETGGVLKVATVSDGSEQFPNSPGMTGANRTRRIS